MGGGCDGQTSLRFIETVGNKFAKIYLVECDKTFQTIISDLINRMDDDRLTLIPKGLYSSIQTLKFGEVRASKTQSQYRVIKSGKSVFEIEAIDLDSYINEATFIKLDIEGSEEQALLGMRRIISKCKPKLAICIYHSDLEMYKLPLLIHSLNPEYKLYVRHYSEGMFETVCYAI